ncbi:hypothetical protein CERSUDRAFT_112111 [Gelatoporia subvermispora B]|uniref:Zn(2)-C6 fungal-type domain-containing protein n=1 Tax=Ceriporiopsis subvermispora (strain B) TaxID=914234 RepID=M2PT25_CERS8|nr:hypothetical protein CERSUDRAFT_112111 [Gelatoporia subvermispora B]
MDNIDRRLPTDDSGNDDAAYSHSRPGTASRRAPRRSSPDRREGETTGYTLMVAGRRTGKTSFLRLLLDTSAVSPFVSREQLASVARFVHGCSGHTTHVRSVSVDVDLAPGDGDGEDHHPLTLTLIDTPSLDYEDEAASQRAVAEILHHVDSRFAESLDDERKAVNGDHHVHLCIYFLDPAYIVPPSMSAPPVPVVPRARTNSLSKPDSEPVILEPPVTTNPLLCRPTLPAADIATIRRLSQRVNVLPVVACADVLTNERLMAVKVAIRRDLADAGIGFGIFDVDMVPPPPLYGSGVSDAPTSQMKSEATNGYSHHLNGSVSAAASPPNSPNSPPLLRLPFALISPDIYSHSDGVSRPTPSRHELAQQYTPSLQSSTKKNNTLSKLVPGKFIRSYRWGSLDVMDANHCDFLHLRKAIFHHMKTLRKYTREYLFDKFKAELQPPRLSPSHQYPIRSSHHSTQVSRLPPPHASRPILAIDTAHSHHRHPSLSVSHGINGDGGVLQPGQPSAMISDCSPKTSSSSRSARARTKKIQVACNFCRSRKLKCDGGRPACSQCSKRSNPCDYMAGSKRRGGVGKRKHTAESESEVESGEDPSASTDKPSLSPEVPSGPPSRRNSNVSMLLADTLPPFKHAAERRGQAAPVLPPIAQTTGNALGGPLQDARPELPPIATLSASSPAVPKEEPVSVLPPEANEDQLAQRRRTSSAAAAPNTKTRLTFHGSKIVACNFCRARKTRCDGAHPTCGSCSRRNLPCNYVNDPTNNPRARSKNAANNTPSGPSASTSARSSPTVQLHPSATAPNGYAAAVHAGGAEYANPPSKKMRMSAEGAPATIAVGSAQ